MRRSIPKIIHYCWFGSPNKPKEVLKYMKSWEKYLPDYQIMEWNEKNFLIEEAPVYVQEAYKAKKYAFVSDYVRMMALYKYGGLYFDTDLEVIREFESFLDNASLILAFESNEMLMTAFIACEKGNAFVKEFLDKYKNRSFFLSDGSYDMTPNTDLWSEQAHKWGVDLSKNCIQNIDNGIFVYPIDYFCGFDMNNYHSVITKNTVTVHHMAFSWASVKEKRHFQIVHALQKVLGIRNYDSLRTHYKRLKNRKK